MYQPINDSSDSPTQEAVSMKGINPEENLESWSVKY